MSEQAAAEVQAIAALIAESVFQAVEDRQWRHESVEHATERALLPVAEVMVRLAEACEIANTGFVALHSIEPCDDCPGYPMDEDATGDCPARVKVDAALAAFDALVKEGE